MKNDDISKKFVVSEPNEFKLISKSDNTNKDSNDKNKNKIK